MSEFYLKKYLGEIFFMTLGKKFWARRDKRKVFRRPFEGETFRNHWVNSMGQSGSAQLLTAHGHFVRGLVQFSLR